MINLYLGRESNTDSSVIQVVSYSLYGRTFYYKRTEIGIALLLVMTYTTAMSANVANFVGRDFVETILRQDQYTFRELGYVV